MTMVKNLDPVIEVEQLTFRYDKQRILDRLSLTIYAGDFLALVGPNGSGKSTLIQCLLGLLQPDAGKIRLFGEDIQQFSDWQKIGYVSQKAIRLKEGFPATVEEVVATGLYKKKRWMPFFTKEEKKKIIQALSTVGMEAYARRNIGRLSGGQLQRVLIARAIVAEPRLLILDEPTVGVDARSSEQFYSLLQTLNREKGVTLLLVTHDIGTVTDKVTKIACLQRSIHFHGSPRLYKTKENEILASLYGHSVHVLEHRH